MELETERLRLGEAEAADVELGTRLLDLTRSIFAGLHFASGRYGSNEDAGEYRPFLLSH